MKLEMTYKANGVDVSRLRETIKAVKTKPALGLFKFQIKNRWIDGGANRSEVKSFHGCGQSQVRSRSFVLSADEPEILLGGDTGVNPVEHLLHALAACVTTSMVYHAAARGIAIEEVESSLEGELDLRGFLGLDPEVRNGYQQIRLTLRIKADVSDKELRGLAKLGQAFSPVYDTLTRGVPILISTERMASSPAA